MTLTLALAVGIGIVAGGLVHEAIHVWTARLLGARVAVDWWRLEAYYQFDHERWWKLAAVNLSPYAVALVGGVLWWLFLLPWGAAPLTAGVMVFLMLLCYGGPEDFRFKRVAERGGPNVG